MKTLLEHFVLGFNWLILIYACAINGSYLVLLLISGVRIPHTLVRDVPTRLDDVFAHPGTPAVSVLVPAYNEEKGIVDAVQSLMALRYPEFELIVVDDGSTDRTFDVLAEEFNLVPVERVVPTDVVVVGELLSVHVQADGGPLVVVRKTNAHRRADALNLALNVARNPLICMIDGDCVLEPDALLHVVKPIVESAEEIVAVGGVVRPVNGSGVRRGEVVTVASPRTMVERIQVVEYLRAFLIGRVGWSAVNGVLVISGAFGLFQREAVIRLGGMHTSSLGEDAELVASMHHTMRDAGLPYRMVVVPQPVCWTEVPATLKALGRQRRRWQHGLAHVLWAHRTAIGRPSFGRFGLIVLPYYIVFELLGPVIEILGLLAVVAGLALGLINLPFAALLFLLSVGFGTLLSVAALMVEEIAFHRHERRRDFPQLLLAALIENVGFRQLHAWWRLRGLADMISLRKPTWGVLPRKGFDPA